MADRYVDTVNGLDGNPGTQVAPWQTAQKAFDATLINETCYLKGIDTLLAQVDVDTQAGNMGAGQPIHMVGCRDGGLGIWIVDGTRLVLDANGAANYCLAWDWASGGYIIENFEFKNALQDNVSSVAGNPDDFIWINCYSHHAVRHGWGSTGGGAPRTNIFLFCVNELNGLSGFGTLYYSLYIGCASVSNNTGFDLRDYSHAVFCLAALNTISGFSYNGPNTSVICCVSDENREGVSAASGPQAVFGSRLTNATGFGGILGNTATVADLFNFMLNNVNGPTFGGSFFPRYRGVADTNLAAGEEGYADRAAGLYNLAFGAGGYRTETVMGDLINYLRFARGLPTSILPTVG